MISPPGRELKHKFSRMFLVCFCRFFWLLWFGICCCCCQFCGLVWFLFFSWLGRVVCFFLVLFLCVCVFCFLFQHEIYYLSCPPSISEERFLFSSNFLFSCYFFLLPFPSHELTVCLTSPYNPCNASSLPALWLFRSTCLNPYTYNCTS